MKKYYFVSEGEVDKVSYIALQHGLVTVALESGKEILLSTEAYNSLKGLKKGDEIAYHQSSSIYKCNSKDQEVNVLASKEDLELINTTMVNGEFI